MKAGEIQLLPFLNGTKQFLIPIYQRTYSWTRTQCEQLWNDIIRVATDYEASSHFVGSVVYIQHGLLKMSSIPQLLVIDGQQRLTTISLLLLALAQAAKETKEPTEVNAEAIYQYYLINSFGKDDLRYKLVLTQNDKDTLIKLIDTPELAYDIKPSHKLLENYFFFRDRIQQSGVDLSTLYLGVSKLNIVEISLGKDDNPQLIFESLNSTGVDLSQADLIRNYVLMGLPPAIQTQLYKNYWYPMEQLFYDNEGALLFDRFMRDYLTIKQGTIPNINEVYNSFKLFHRSKSGITLEELVKDIHQYARYFANLALGTETDRDIKRAMQSINNLKVDVAYPFLLEVYDDYTHKNLSRENFLEILKLVESYVFRRSVCGIPTNALNKVFVALAREIEKEHYLESVKAAFLSKTASARFPRDDEFITAFVAKDFYNYPRRYYLLSNLENHERKERVYIEEYTVEHIMPQNEHLSKEWQQELGLNWQEIQGHYLHTIGNLTLTGYNSKLSDRPFLHKRDDKDGGFAHSPIRLNDSLARLEHWNEEEIKRRAALLANKAIQIWAVPQMSSDQIKRFNKQGQKAFLAEVVGPIDHPLLGFVPEGFRLVQSSEKRFYLFREVDNEWVQYGNGKNPWFAISWEYAKGWINEKYQKNERPLGVGGENIQRTSLSIPDEKILTDYSSVYIAPNGNVYSLKDYQYLTGPMLSLFEQLRKRILNLDVSIREEYKKMYIAYKAATNFVDIEPQKKRLRLWLNMPFKEIDDPKRLCKNVSDVGHYGNGDIEVNVTLPNQLEDIMDLIRQSFERQQEDVLI